MRTKHVFFIHKGTVVLHNHSDSCGVQMVVNNVTGTIDETNKISIRFARPSKINRDNSTIIELLLTHSFSLFFYIASASQNCSIKT